VKASRVARQEVAEDDGLAMAGSDGVQHADDAVAQGPVDVALQAPNCTMPLRKRDVKIGHFVGEFLTPGIGYIVKEAGCDYVTFDMEHSGLAAAWL
jgi:hypothetical protein